MYLYLFSLRPVVGAGELYSCTQESAVADISMPLHDLDSVKNCYNIQMELFYSNRPSNNKCVLNKRLSSLFTPSKKC